MAWRRIGGKPLSEPMLTRRLCELVICVQWLVICLGPRQYISQSWIVVNRALRNKQQWSLNQNPTFFLSRKLFWKCRLQNFGSLCTGLEQCVNTPGKIFPWNLIKKFRQHRKYLWSCRPQNGGNFAQPSIYFAGVNNTTIEETLRTLLNSPTLMAVGMPAQYETWHSAWTSPDHPIAIGWSKYRLGLPRNAMDHELKWPTPGGGYSSSSRAGRLGRTLWPRCDLKILHPWRRLKKGVKILQWPPPPPPPPPNARKGGSIFYISMKSLQKKGVKNLQF